MGRDGERKEKGGRHCIGELKRWGKEREECVENDEAAGAGVLHY